MADKEGTLYFTPAEVAESFHYEQLKFAEVSRWLVTRLHPSGIWCPTCSADLGHSERRWQNWYALEQIRCNKCGKKFSAATGTILEGSKLEPREVYLLAFLLWLKIPTPRIADILKVDPATVRNWQLKFSALAEAAGA